MDENDPIFRAGVEAGIRWVVAQANDWLAVPTVDVAREAPPAPWARGKGEGTAETVTCDGRGSLRFKLPDGRMCTQLCPHCKTLGRSPTTIPRTG
jgi:hypothetical protein